MAVVRVSLVLALAALLASPAAPLQRRRIDRDITQGRRLERPVGPIDTTRREFTFARLEYDSVGWGESWQVDWPKADEQFLLGMKHWVRSAIDISELPITVAIKDPAIFEYPFIYVVEPGMLDLSREQAEQLREYLLRGGFLMLDDFWGEWEWRNVREQLRRVLPEFEVQELELSHPVFHCYFDIDEVLQVPNFHNYVFRGRTHEKGGFEPHYDAIIDDAGRILVFIARNADNGDAWEWIDDPRYPLKYGLGAYRLATNLIIYSMTH
ncbi:MAG: DUF4159 domain-containing protein [Acidobacteria bacterium]|nr:DUF4159 domain-containing protein [Acidobacteriota bacterium]MCW5967108.1 DUF4159 domain-containing protein [Blastocatellales bacterium]